MPPMSFTVTFPHVHAGKGGGEIPMRGPDGTRSLRDRSNGDVTNGTVASKVDGRCRKIRHEEIANNTTI